MVYHSDDAVTAASASFLHRVRSAAVLTEKGERRRYRLDRLAGSTRLHTFTMCCLPRRPADAFALRYALRPQTASTVYDEDDT